MQQVKRLYPTIKRILDIAASVAGLLIFSPMLLILALLIRITMGSPILFKQVRPGLYDKPFLIYKFRTMLDREDQFGHPLPDFQRLTSFGKFLRKTSLDELPELWNVLKGDMSLVGPRPLLTQYLPLYNDFQKKRHDVKPGITGWAQVNGRNAITWDQKFDYDVWYIDNQSFLLDVRILVKTLVKVFIREGISAPGEATMKAFDGSPDNI